MHLLNHRQWKEKLFSMLDKFAMVLECILHVFSFAEDLKNLNIISLDIFIILYKISNISIFLKVLCEDSYIWANQIPLWFLRKWALCKFAFIISDFPSPLILKSIAHFSKIW